MAGLSGERLFRLEAGGRTVGRFRSVERAGARVALMGWAWERGVTLAAVPNGTIVLMDADGCELRRWRCGLAAPNGQAMLAERIRR